MVECSNYPVSGGVKSLKYFRPYVYPGVVPKVCNGIDFYDDDDNQNVHLIIPIPHARYNVRTRIEFETCI